MINDPLGDGFSMSRSQRETGSSPRSPVAVTGRGPRGRAASYLRVSTGGQAHGASIDIQRDQCRAAAELHRLTLVGDYVDAGVSGARAARPAVDE